MNNAKLLDDVREFKSLLIKAATGQSWTEGDFATKYQELRSVLVSQSDFRIYMPDFVWSCRELGEFWQHISNNHKTYSERRAYLSKEFEPLVDFLEYGTSPHTYSAVLKRTLLAWLNAGGDSDIASELDQCRFHAYEDGDIAYDEEGGTPYDSVSVRIHASRLTYDKLNDMESIFRKKVDGALKACISGRKYFGRIILEALVFDTALEGTIFQEIPDTSEVVMESWKKLLQRQQSDPTGAITAARTLVEDVCKYILDELKEPYTSHDDLPELYKKVAKKLKLAPENHREDVYKQILGGTNSVVSGLASLRNALGDSHGKGEKAPKPSPRHARLAVNVAATAALFLIETYQSRSQEEDAR